MKVCLGQINTTPGDFAGNTAAIKSGIDRASHDACDVVVFPELSIPGYLSQDLIYHREFLDRNIECLNELVKYTRGLGPRLHVIVGYIDRNPGAGKPFFNMAAVIADGEVLGRYKKQLLPFYDVFDELRYFEPGKTLLILPIADRQVGITICEDLWNDKASDDYNYTINPMQHYIDAGADVIVSLNSSPYVHNKLWQRLSVIAPSSEMTRAEKASTEKASTEKASTEKASTEKNMTVIYVNQRGGQDELVFDGQSFVVSNGDLLHLSSACEQDSFDVLDLNLAKPIIAKVYQAVHREEIEQMSLPLFDLLVLCLRDYVKKSGFSTLVLASSGGVDSAVVCKLACAAVGAKNVHAIRMPSVFSSEHARLDAIALHENLGCWDYEVDVAHDPVVAMLNARYLAYPDDEQNLVTQKMQSGYAGVADENMQARLRDLYLMHFSNAFGAMPLSTGNKTESACGYYTHFDMNMSFAPIKDLYKFQVMDIARDCPEIPDNIWRKPPSAELAEGQTDEESLLSYAVLDPIVRAYIEDYVSTYKDFLAWSKTKIESQGKISMDQDFFSTWLDSQDAPSEFRRIIGLIGRMEFKRRQTCPGVKVSKVAFGSGRRIPIVNKWS